MSEQEYLTLNSAQVKICGELTKLKNIFTKANYDRRKSIAAKFEQTIEECATAARANDVKLHLIKNSELSGHTYYTNNFHGHIEKLISELRALILPFNIQPSETMATGGDQTLDLLHRLAALQLRQADQDELRNEHRRQPEEKKPGDVFNIASKIFVRFSESNLTNFLESVELALSIFTEEADTLSVLKFAKLRVTGSATIESQTFSTFEEFRTAMLAAFKPKRTVTEIEQKISQLMQDEKESVDSYSKRVFNLKVEYEQASRASRAAIGEKLDKVRIVEMEAKIATAFINGLKSRVITFVTQKPATLTEAVSVSLEAESTCDLRFQNKKNAFPPKRMEDGKGKFYEQKKGAKGAGKGHYDKRDSKTSTSNNRSDVKCHNCGKHGHIRPKCPELVQEGQAEVSTLNARTSDKREYKKEGAKPKNESGGVSVSAKSLKIRKLH